MAEVGEKFVKVGEEIHDDGACSLAAALEAVAFGAARGGGSRQVVAAAVASCIRTWRSCNAPPSAPCENIVQLEEVLASAKQATGSQHSVKFLVEGLRDAPDLRRRVRRLSSARNRAAHPDVGLAEEVARHLQKAKDKEEPEEEGEAAEASSTTAVATGDSEAETVAKDLGERAEAIPRLLGRRSAPASSIMDSGGTLSKNNADDDDENEKAEEEEKVKAMSIIPGVFPPGHEEKVKGLLARIFKDVEACTSQWHDLSELVDSIFESAPTDEALYKLLGRIAGPT